MLYPKEFTKWWCAYPRKVAKKRAVKLWKIAVAEIAAEQEVDKDTAQKWLLSRTELFAKSDQGRAGIYCPHPSTWLNDARYDDDVDTWNNQPVASAVPNMDDLKDIRF